MFPSQMVRLETCRTLKCPTFFSMFHSQMVRLEIVEPSSGKTFSMFNSEMVCLKIVEPSSSPLCPCFPRKFYALKLSKSQVAHFFHVSHANGIPWSCRNLKWPTDSMFPSQMVRLKIVEPSSGPPFAMFPSQMVRLKIVERSSLKFFHVSFSNFMF